MIARYKVTYIYLLLLSHHPPFSSVNLLVFSFCSLSILWRRMIVIYHSLLVSGPLDWQCSRRTEKASTTSKYPATRLLLSVAQVSTLETLFTAVYALRLKCSVCHYVILLRSLYRFGFQVNICRPYAYKCHLLECRTIRQVTSRYGKLCRYFLHHSTYTNIGFTQ